ncbi:carbohydrate ABC transporter permease [Thermanaerothrix sp.]|jgi:multiple sugar transport system permease protein|uniref:carbohydrate ABC transporter permease n=1 Tax=Thermanaerothrix sp. TaxID=2972675 RepID=UPI002ADD74B4|nr:carbohydrate ABC transporter permease [Thermanaerothrix sp.]
MTTISHAQPRMLSWSDRLILWYDRLKTPLFYLILILWAIICVAPLYFTLVFSLKPVANAYDPPLFWPIPFTLDNFRDVIGALPLFPRWLLNSLIVSLTVTILRILFCAMGGYAFARMEFPLKGFLFNAMLVSMMIPGQVTLIPAFLVVGPGIIRGGLKIGDITLPTGFGLIDNLGGVILPGIVTAFGVFMMTQFYKSLPRELEEAAMMDGLGRWGIFFRIVLPLSQTQLLTLALLTFQGEWNAFMWPLIILRTPENFTLPLGLNWFRGEYYTLISKVLAGSLFNTLPILILFFIFQRYFVQSIAGSGLKEG